MVSVKPFSYLTGETRPPKLGFRKPDEVYGTGLNVSSQSSSELNSSVDSGHLMHSSAVETFYEGPHHNGQPINVDMPPDAGSPPQKSEVNYKQQTPDVKYIWTKQSEANDLEKQFESSRVSYERNVLESNAKYAMNEKQEDRLNEKINYGFVTDLPRTSRDHFYGRQNQKRRDRPHQTNEEPRTNLENDGVSVLYGQVNRNRDRETENTKEQSSSPTDSSNKQSSPFSYYMQPSELVGLSETIRNEIESTSKDYNILSEFREDRFDVNEPWTTSSPSSTAEPQNPFENFILVGPGKKESRQEDAASAVTKEPTKRLKLQELFDPPPPSMISSRKVAIFGVTNTESSDFHTGSLEYTSLTKDGNHNRLKGPVSTFDNPDYSSSSAYSITNSNAQIVSDNRSQISRTATNSTITATSDRRRTEDKKMSGKPSSRARGNNCYHRGLCIAIFVTALITAIICLGAGFVAGWFGKEASLRNEHS